MPCWLVVMAKVARAGAVKTRLGREIGAVAATSFYRTTSAAVVDRLAADPRWRLVLAVSPDFGVDVRAWPSARRRLAQGSGDLGQRMQHLLDVLPPGPAVVIGTDIPGIRPAHIARCFRLAARHGAVLAPALDGGYWAVGQRRSPRILAPFAKVRWSHAETLADTMRGFRPASVALADRLGDVDDAAAWRATRASSGRRVLPAG